MVVLVAEVAVVVISSCSDSGSSVGGSSRRCPYNPGMMALYLVMTAWQHVTSRVTGNKQLNGSWRLV